MLAERPNPRRPNGCDDGRAAWLLQRVRAMNIGPDATASREDAQVVLELQRSTTRILIDQMQDDDEVRLREARELILQSRRLLDRVDAMHFGGHR